MDSVYLKRIFNSDKKFYKYYNMAVLWDNKRKCFTNKDSSDSDLIGMFEYTYLLYLNDNIIGYGIIFYAPKLDEFEEEAYLTCIIRPEYRKKGYGQILLKQLEDAAKNDLNISNVKVEILKNNIPSITLAENSDYEFESFDNRKIVFKKELK